MGDRNHHAGTGAGQHDADLQRGLGRQQACQHEGNDNRGNDNREDAYDDDGGESLDALATAVCHAHSQPLLNRIAGVSGTRRRRMR